MKLLLIVSAFTSISAIRVPSAWQPQPNINNNLNNVVRDNRPTRQETLTQPRPNYINNNPFLNNVQNTVSNGLLAKGNILSNLPIDYNWFSPGTPNNGFVFATPTNQLSSGSLLNNINPFSNNGNEIRKNPYVQQRQQGPPRLIQPQRNFNRRPVGPIIPDPASYKEIPGKVPYITYTTQGPSSQTTAFSTLKPVQNSDQTVNIKQAYPQVTSPKTALPLTDLDFSPRNPFPNQQESQASTQVNNPSALFGTSQPINTLDFNLNNPFSRNPHVNGYGITQIPQTQIPNNRPFVAAPDNRVPNSVPGLRNLEFNPFTKNYRDHRTHEPTDYEPHYDREAVPVVERLQSEKAPIVKNHEHPDEVPTKPFYPGEGQWAKPGVKHRPFVSNQQYTNIDESNETPDGYDTFLEGQKLFENQKRQFGDKFQQAPVNNNAPTHYKSTEENTEESETFVPTRLYAQVRHSEDEKHLPPESDDNGRLKELIKDTKIQTIYSEEGFEDSAYDHAGHEKKAENQEAFESDEKKEELKDKKKIPVKNYDRQSASYSIGDQDLKEDDIEKNKENELNLENENEGKGDSEPAGTHYEEQSYLNKIKPTKNKDGIKKVKTNGFIKSKEIKTVTAKDKGGGNIEMEISSEVKAIVQPNNSTKFHKFVKIYPKINRNESANVSLTGNVNVTLPQIQVEAEKRSMTIVPDEIFIEEVTNRTNGKNSIEFVSTTVTPTEYADIVTMEIPITTQATTAIPKSVTKIEFITEKSTDNVSLNLKRRRKRSVGEIPNVKVDTDFIDKINHDIGKPTEKSNKPNEKKYPYYKNYKEKGLHENSPLRYSEDLQKVPIKTEGKLAFYDLADRKMACSDVNPEVDPVPDRIKNADESVEEEEEDEEGNDPAAKGPRLGQLGDKIDCFKTKYFGENPLDNPFFQEELVGPVNPIFKEIENISTKKLGASNTDNLSKESNSRSTRRETPTNVKIGKEQLQAAASSYDAENEIDDRKLYKYGLTSWFPGKTFGMGENTERDSKFINNFVEKNSNPKVNLEQEDIKAKDSKESAKDVQTLPPATLITTPKYTINLKPKHIYDQIQLLEYLPEEELYEVKKEISADIPKINKTEVTTAIPNKNKKESSNAPVMKNKKKSTKKSIRRKAKVLKNNEENMKMETSDNGKPESLPEDHVLQLIRPKPKKPMYEIFDINKFLPKVPKIHFPPSAPIPTNSKYLAPVSIINPTYEVFDINKYLPTTPFPLFKDFMTRSTVLPKLKVISEVFYKEDIKPNEQLNVFTDVLNNIRNFPTLKDNFPESSQSISVKLNTEKILEKYPQNFVQDTDADNKDYFSSTVTTIMTTFDPKTYASNHKYLQVEDPVSTEKQIDGALNNHKIKNKPKRRRRVKTTTPETSMIIEESTSTLQYIGKPTEVMGLMPPVIQGYKTIHHPKRDSGQQLASPTIRIEERKVNKYFVQGMRPPPKQKVYLYSDFLTDNHIGRRVSKPRRSKRSAQRPAYAQVSRNRNKQPDPELEAKKEEDDYVPHRTRNYHYDEKTGKIVYDKQPKKETEEEEEVEYIEVIEETPQTTAKPKQNPIFATVTPPPEGQSYTDFVKLLKSASGYREIPDPTTTEKAAEEITQKMAASTLQPVSTNPPEFLAILDKVRNDSTYKLIEDKKKTTTSKSTEDEEEEAESSDEESQVENVKNSPGGQGYETGTNLEIFDISDFLPNIKSYLPKTQIDTSKYKTIERPHMRHSLSSRYNSEEDKDLQNINTSKQPILSSTGTIEKIPITRTEQEKVNEPVQVQSRSTPSNSASTSAPEVTTQKIVRIPGRRRTTTARSVPAPEVTSTSEASVINHDSDAVQNDKARRNYRRRPVRIKIHPTAQNSSEADTTKKIVRRRSERDSHLHAAGNEKIEQIVDSDFDVPKPLIREDEYVDYEVPESSNNTEAKQLETIGVVAKKVVDIFKNYDKDQKHGGNYKKEDEVNKDTLPAAVVPSGVNQNNSTEAVETFKVYDKTKKHGGNYKVEKEAIVKPKDVTELKLIKVDPKDVKNVEIFKNFDNTKKHGGNYRPANEGSPVNDQDESELVKNESIQIKNVNIFQDYDKTEKHGGNYRSENDTFEVQKANIESEPVLLKNIEVFKDYDKTKKHGGNYKPENNLEVQEQQLGESQFGSPQSRQNNLNTVAEKRSVDIFQEYDKTKKHGGNYIRENAKTEKENKPEKQQPLIDKAKDVEIFKGYDEEKKTGGNYKVEEEIKEPNVDETHYVNTKTPQIKRYIGSRNDIQRLTDVVLKPETFYSDVKLPLDINALKIVKDLSNEELEEIVESAEVDVDDKNKEESLRRDDSAAVKIGNRITLPSTRLIPQVPPAVREPITTTKKPLFIKDPSKRLYFYAPVR